MSASFESTTALRGAHPLAPSLRKLPSGRHGLPRELVACNQRERLLEAVVEVVAAGGYARASITGVARAAGVTEAALYQHFATKQDCLLAACDAALGWLLLGLEEAIAAARDWARGVREGLRVLLERVAAEPQLARVCFVELYALDLVGGERRGAALERLAVALRPPAGNPPNITPVCEEVIAGGVWNAIQSAIVRDAFADLPRLLPALHYHVLVYHVGPEQANQIARESR